MATDRHGIQRVTIGRHTRIVHIETPLGMISIHLDLTDHRGRRVEAVMMDPNRMIGEKVVKVIGHRFVEMKRLKWRG